MKRIISFILAAAMCIFSSIAVSAESNEISFPMITNTGIINLEATNELSMILEPTITENDNIIIQTNDDAPNITSVKLVVSGERNNWNYISSSEYDFINYYDASCTIPATKSLGKYWKLDTRLYTASNGQFLNGVYSKIYSMNIIATGYIETYLEEVYYDWGDINSKIDDVIAFSIVKDFTYYSEFTHTITELIKGIKNFSFVSKEVRNDYSYLPCTDSNHNGIITRDEVVCLSYSENGTGQGIPGFEGLASQISTFFNKKNNGTITFHVTTAPAAFSNTWVNGGIPSVQTTLSNFNNFNNSIMGLFFNYEITGTLVSSAIIDGNGEITFDISNVLNDIDGNTLAIIKSVYYGLTGGSTYKYYLANGLKIESITLSYENEAAETTAITIEPVTTVDTTIETIESITNTNITTTEEPIDIDVYDDDEIIEIIDDDEDEEVEEEKIETAAEITNTSNTETVDTATIEEETTKIVTIETETTVNTTTTITEVETTINKEKPIETTTTIEETTNDYENDEILEIIDITDDIVDEITEVTIVDNEETEETTSSQIVTEPIDTTTTTTEPEIVAIIDETPIDTTTDIVTNVVDNDDNPRTGVGLIFITPIIAAAIGLVTSKKK